MALFLKKILAGSKETADINSELEGALTIYMDITTPMLESVIPMERTFGYNGKVGKLLSNTTAGLKGRNVPPAQTLKLVFADFSDKITKLQKLIKNELGSRVAENGLDLRQANILEYSAQFSFVLRYCNLALNMLLVEETEDDYSSERYAKNKVEWLDQNSVVFTSALKILEIDISRVISAMTKIPQVRIDMDADEFNSAGFGDSNPLRMGFLPVKLNPFYYINMAIAEYRDSKYQAALKQKLWFEQQLAMKKNQNQGKSDAATEKLVKHYTEQWEKTDSIIREYEDSL